MLASLYVFTNHIGFLSSERTRKLFWIAGGTMQLCDDVMI